MTEELMRRMVQGETLAGEEAAVILGLAEDDWRLAVYIALADLQLGQPEQAADVLRELLAAHGE